MANTESVFFVNLEKDFDKRFDQGKFMEFSNNAFDVLNSFFLLKLKSLPVFGEFLVQSEEKKPDLVSFKIYEDTQYWWILLLYNDLFDSQDLVTGTVLQFPSVTDLDEFFFSIKTQETQNVI